jgi:hypothetical protein
VQGVQIQLRFRDTTNPIVVGHGVSDFIGRVSLRVPAASYEVIVTGHGFRSTDVLAGSGDPIRPEGGPVEVVVGQSNQQGVFGATKDDVFRQAEANHLAGLLSQIQWCKYVIPETFTSPRKQFRDENADPDDTFSNLALQEFSAVYKGGSRVDWLLLATDPDPDYGVAVVRTTEGLIWFDDFTGTGSLDGYNGWTVQHGTINITAGVVDPTNESWGEKAFTFPSSEEIIVQANLLGDFPAIVVGNATNPTGGARIFTLSGASGYYQRHRNNLDRFELFRANDSSYTSGIIKTGGVDPASNWNTNRIVIEKGSGTTRIISGWYSSNIGGSEGDSGTLTQFDTDYTDASAPAADQFTHIQLDFNDGVPGADAVFVCGRNIVINGLPSGWKVRLNTDAPVTESGGSVTYNVDDYQLPVATLKILNAADITQATFNEASGIWGGDVYQVFA